MACSLLTVSLKKKLTCSFCQGIYRNPKTLPCLHNFCFNCLKEMLRNTKLFEQVLCPVCKYGVDLADNVALQALPSPYFISSLQKVLDCGEDELELTCSSCDSHSLSSSFCFDCKCLVCSDCIEIHEHLKTMRTHKILDLENINSQDMRELVQGMRNCSRKAHQTEPLEFHCMDCGECVCEKCRQTDHRQHSIHKIREARLQTDQKVRKFVTKLNEKISSCQVIIEKIDLTYNSAVEKIVAVRKNVRDKINSLVRVLRTHEKNMISQLERIQLDLKQDILSNKKAYEDLLFQMVNTQDVVGEIVERGIDVELLNLHNSILQRINELTVVPVGETKHKAISFDYAHNDNILEMLENTDFGEIKVSYTDPTSSVITDEDQLHNAVTRTGERVLFGVVTKDSEGNISYSDDDRLSVTVKSEKHQTIQPRIEDLKDGNYKVSFTPLKSDVLEIHLTVMGETIRGSPFQMHVQSSGSYLHESLDSTRSSTDSDRAQTPIMSAVTMFGLSNVHFGRPCGIALNTKSDVISVADSKNKVVHVLGVDGKILRKLGRAEKSSSAYLSNPVGTAFDRDDNVLVTDCDKHVIKVFDPSGQCKRSFGSRHLQRPLGICCSQDGSIFVCDSLARSIKKFSAKGSFQSEFTSPDLHPSGKCVVPYFLACHKDKIFATFDNHSVQVFDNQGAFLYKIGDKGHGEGRFKDPRGLAVDSNDRLFVCDTGNHRVQVFAVDGRVSLFGSYGAKLGELDRPQDIAISRDGMTFITDYNNARIQVFKPQQLTLT